jgi:hypothetical protein
MEVRDIMMLWWRGGREPKTLSGPDFGGNNLENGQ